MIVRRREKEPEQLSHKRLTDAINNTLASWREQNLITHWPEPRADQSGEIDRWAAYMWHWGVYSESISELRDNYDMAYIDE